MAAVRVENEAWSDPRYGMLAGLCGYKHPRFALIQCAWVWSYCTQEETDVHEAAIIDAHVQEPGFAAKMVKARLAERVRGGIRIKGTKGRIEWLGKLKKNGALGGLAKASKRLASAKQEPGKLVALDQHSASKTVASYSYSSSLSSSDEEKEKSARAVPSEPKLEHGEPTPEPPLAEVLRLGYRKLFHDKLKSFPSENFGVPLAKLVAWSRENAPEHKTTEAALGLRVLAGLFRSAKAAEKNYPLTWAAQNPLEFLGGPEDGPPDPPDVAVARERARKLTQEITRIETMDAAERSSAELARKGDLMRELAQLTKTIPSTNARAAR